MCVFGMHIKERGEFTMWEEDQTMTCADNIAKKLKMICSDDDERIRLE